MFIIRLYKSFFIIAYLFELLLLKVHIQLIYRQIQISTNGNITTDLMNTFIHTVNIARSEHIHYMMIFLMAGLKSIAYNWLTDGCKTSSHTLAQIAFKQYQSLLDC